MFRFALLFSIMLFTNSLIKAQIDPLKTSERIINRTANNTEKRLEQDLNKEIDKSIDRTLNPESTKSVAPASNSKKTVATTTPKQNNTVDKKNSDSKINQSKPETKPAQNNSVRATGSLLPPTK